MYQRIILFTVHLCCIFISISDHYVVLLSFFFLVDYFLFRKCDFLQSLSGWNDLESSNLNTSLSRKILRQIENSFPEHFFRLLHVLTRNILLSLLQLIQIVILVNTLNVINTIKKIKSSMENDLWEIIALGDRPHGDKMNLHWNKHMPQPISTSLFGFIHFGSNAYNSHWRMIQNA